MSDIGVLISSTTKGTWRASADQNTARWRQMRKSTERANSYLLHGESVWWWAADRLCYKHRIE